MPTDPLPRSPSANRRQPSRFASLLDRKLTPTIFVLFFVALAVMCAAAAGIGYVSQNLRHAEVRR